LVLQITGPKVVTLARENRSRRHLQWQRRRRQKRRNTNRQRDDTSHLTRFFTGLLREAPLRRLFRSSLMYRGSCRLGLKVLGKAPYSTTHPQQANSIRRCIVSGRQCSLGPLLLLASVAVSCGGSRHLQTVTLQPSTATAQNGQFQFAATGTFSAPPSPVTLTSKDVTWCTGELTAAPNASPNSCVGNVSPFATVDQNGLATCGSASHGTGYILAGTQQIVSMNPDGGSQFKIFGYAALTCP